MRIRTQQTGRAIVELTGRVDAIAVQTQRPTLLSMLDDGTTRIVVDLSRTEFLDSAAMAMLVSLMKRARQAGGDVRVVEPADASVRRILHLTRLDLVLNMRPSCDAALDGL
jgi:anti-sigma B factor antagonist